MWTRPISPVVNDEYSYAVAFVSRRTDGYPYPKSVTLAEIGLTSAQGYEFQVTKHIAYTVLITYFVGSIIYTDEINILQDLYDPESPPQVLKPDSILSVRVNPSGELFFF